MKIIDAHLHFVREDEYFDGIAAAAGHINSEEHLREQFDRLDVVCGIVMGNRGLELEDHRYPEFLRYCIGLDSGYLADKSVTESLDLIEKHLRKDQCVGIKLYPGYCPAFITDPAYEPVYELAEQYGKAVAVHTGATAGSNALLKYSHPLTLDEAAVLHPRVQFVMCHFGNPWLMDAAAVLEKNENVAADLSGLLEGRVDVDAFFLEKSGYTQQLSAWLGYLHEYDRVMFGTDWPLVNLSEYQRFIRRIVPEKYYEKVFFENAKKIYKLNV